VIQLVIVGVVGCLWAAMWSFSGRVWPVSIEERPGFTEDGGALPDRVATEERDA
jgi:hypothetical protein